MSIVAIPHYQRFTQVEFLRCFEVVLTGPLITIDGTMDQILYREVLEKYFIPELKAAELLGGDWKLMQGNAPCHKAKSINAFLYSEGIDMIEWPPYKFCGHYDKRLKAVKKAKDGETK